MKKVNRGTLPSTPMPLNYYVKIVERVKPIFGKHNPVFISNKTSPWTIYELISENETELELFKKYHKNQKNINKVNEIHFDLDRIKDV